MNRIDRLVSALAARITTGQWTAGQKLLSLRQAAEAHQVAKNTMVEVYDRLVSQGLIEARAGAGFFVRGPRSTTPLTLPETPRVLAEAFDSVSLLREQLDQTCPVRAGDGRPPHGWMEGSELARHLRPRLNLEQVSSGYGLAQGFLPLRQAIADMLAERGIAVDAQSIVTTFGANHALDIIIRRMVRPGDAVLVDSPGYYPLFAKLKLAGAMMIGINRTVDGPDFVQLQDVLSRVNPKLYILQSHGHNPTGTSLSVQAAHQLLAMTHHHPMLIVEDDPFADCMPISLSRLAMLDGLRRVIYVGSFAKTLSASLRVGYLAAPTALVADLLGMKMLSVVNSAGYAEHLVADLIASGHYRRHLGRLVNRMDEAARRTKAALQGIGWRVQGPAGGFYVWAEAAQPFDDLALAQKAFGQGIFLAPGSVFYPDQQMANGALRINIAYGDDPRLISFLKAEVSASADAATAIVPAAALSSLR